MYLLSGNITNIRVCDLAPEAIGVAASFLWGGNLSPQVPHTERLSYQHVSKLQNISSKQYNNVRVHPNLTGITQESLRAMLVGARRKVAFAWRTYERNLICWRPESGK